MSRSKLARVERNAGACIGPHVMVPVPMRTPSDNYRDAPRLGSPVSQSTKKGT
jgi:hypothetical protein